MSEIFLVKIHVIIHQLNTLTESHRKFACGHSFRKLKSLSNLRSKLFQFSRLENTSEVISWGSKECKKRKANFSLSNSIRLFLKDNSCRILRLKVDYNRLSASTCLLPQGTSHNNFCSSKTWGDKNTSFASLIIELEKVLGCILLDDS